MAAAAANRRDSKDLGSFDYVIVGAGTAGCLLANRLSENPKNRVLVLEAGGRDTNPWIHVPVGYLYTQGNPSTDWCFKLDPEEGLNGRTIGYARGKTLGGCSSINGMIYIRGQAADYDHWRQLGCTGWGWDDVLPIFLQHEGNQAMGDVDGLHKKDGPWRVEWPRITWDLLDDWRDAAAEFGIPQVEDFNKGDNLGSSYFQVNQKSGVRWNTAKAFLKPAEGRQNLTVVTKAHTTKICFDDAKKATEIELLVDGKPAFASINGELVLSAGSIGSPHLLQLSGVGDPKHLKGLGLDVVIDSDGVGANLQDHLQLRAVYKLEGNPKTLNGLMKNPLNKLWMGMDYAFRRRGPLTMAPSQVGAFAKSNERFETANVQYHIQPLSLDKFGDPLHDFPAITASVCDLRPESRGHVKAKTPNPLDHPSIWCNYLSTPGDRKVAAESLKLTRQIMLESAALAKYKPTELKPGLTAQTEEELAQAAGDIGTTIYHPAGTCRMGNDAASVVDTELRLRGAQNIRVADCSVMPTIVSGNTNSPTLMIAEKAATMILAG